MKISFNLIFLTAFWTAAGNEAPRRFRFLRAGSLPKAVSPLRSATALQKIFVGDDVRCLIISLVKLEPPYVGSYKS
jgi:hypothetical protein